MNSEHTQNVKEELKNIFDNTGLDVFCVSFGNKQKNSVFTDEKSIRFGVARKKPLSEIPPEKVIPSTMVVDGIEYKTDVFEVKKMFHVDIQKVSDEIDNPFENTFLSGADVEAGVAAGMEFTHCSTYKLVTNTPGATVSVVVQNQCGARSSSYLSITDGSTFCFDNVVTSSGGPVAGPGYSWVLHDPYNNGLSYRCLQFYTCNINSNVNPPISEHRGKIRPIIGGISMINRQVDGQGYAGTLGGIVIDQTDNKMVGLTNAHVSGTPAYLNGGSHMGYFYANEVSGGYYSHYDGIENTQPSNGDNFNASYLYISGDKIGTTKRIFPLTINDYNYIDCAILNLSSSVVDTNSWKQKNLDLATPSVFATTAEIDSITISTPLMTSGRTSGPKGTYVTQSSYYTDANVPYLSRTTTLCNFVATSTSTTAAVSGYTANGDVVYFADCIMLQNEYPYCITPTVGGDSGSLLYAYIGGAWKIVGLIFAGNGFDLGLACRIDRVASSMKLQAYTGSAVDSDPNPRSQIVLDYATYGGEASASIDGKTYWQLGKNFL